MERQAGLGIDGETVVEGQRAMRRLPRPGGVDHVVVHVGLEAGVPRPRRRREKRVDRRERGEHHAREGEEQREAPLRSASNVRGKGVQGSSTSG